MRWAFLFALLHLFVILTAATAQQFNDSIAPTTSIASPANGSTVKGRISIDATACDNVGVVKVEFLLDGSAVGNDLTYPFNLSWSSRTVPNGAHILKSKASDAAGNATTSTGISITINNETVPPTTSITSPTSGALLQGNVTVSANASDNVAINRVEFYSDAVLIGIDSTSPFNTVWNSVIVADGAHTLTSKAWDTSENGTTSAPVAVAVDNNAPTISITSPTGGASLRGTVPVAANASDGVGVSKVEFYAEANLLGTDNSSPYSLNWNTGTITDGNHALTAKAYDAIGHVTTSSTVNVKVDNTLPSTSITAPTAGTTVTFGVNIAANAFDNIGVMNVEFYTDSTLIGSDATPPYGFVWNSTSVTNGSHQLKSKAYDQAGNSTLSSPVNITVNNPAVLFFDDFEDGNVSDWTFTGGTWSVISGNLTGNGVSQKALAPFSGCVNCSIEGDLQSAGGATSNVSLVGWYQDSKNYVELILKVNANSWDLIQKSAGKNAAKMSFTQSLNANTNYRVKLSFDGTNFKAYVNGTLVITMPAGAPATGKVGFGADNTTGTFREIVVY